MRYMDGRTSEGGKAYNHRVGFIEGKSGNHSFVILTKGQDVGGGRTPHAQELTMRELTRDVTGFVV